jgi:PBSX family phage terminase large subunit
MIQTLSPKQKNSLINSDARINIWLGSVRSGKTFSSLIRFVEFIIKAPRGDMLISGRTDRAIKRNIINPLIDLLGDSDVKYSSGKGEVVIFKRTLHIVGANDERAENKIRGMTIIGAYIDEATIIPESFFAMVLSRLSLSGAKLFTTTNPDGPYHWLKVNYLDRADNLDLKYWHFLLEDNPSLDDAYVSNLKKEYVGLWYKRYIDGLWVLADGTIYDMFDEKFHVISSLPGKAKNYLVGIDYGTNNPTAFVLIGHNKDLKPQFWLEKEYYYDSKKTNRQKTDGEYAKDLVEFIKGYSINKFYLDPSAASFKAELRNHRIFPEDADNSVLDGIRTQSNLLASGDYKILNCCHNAIKEYSSYIWDTRAAKQGIDKPLKKNDHSLDAQRYVLHSFSNKSFYTLEAMVKW